MRFRSSFRNLLTVVLLVCVQLVPVQAQSYLMMPDSTNNRVVLFDPFNGAVLNTNYFGLAAGTPVHAMQVGNEIWVSEQVGDRVSRWDLTGNALGAIGPTFTGGGFDNIRGMGLINNTVYVTNAGTANGAPGAAILSFNTAGNFQSTFTTAGLAPSPFGILSHQGGMLVSSSSANDDIHRFSLAGASLGTFHNTTSLNFAEQMYTAANGNILVAGFSSNNVVRLDGATGAFISQFTAAGPRGVWELGNGNILWTNGSGAHIYDGVSSTQIYTGGGRYLDLLQVSSVPEPGVWLLSVTGLAGGYWWIRRSNSAKKLVAAKSIRHAKNIR